MREILFRGKDFETKEWVEGFLSSKHTISVTSPLENVDEIVIIPETVSQYTGLKDKNGKKIFEGDIVRIDWMERRRNNPVVIIQSVGEVIFDDLEWIVSRDYKYISYGGNSGDDRVIDGTERALLSKINKAIKREGAEIEVIGNVFDNPELIEDKRATS